MALSTVVSGIPSRLLVYLVVSGKPEDHQLTYLTVNRSLSIRCRVSVPLTAIQEHLSSSSPGWSDSWWDMKLMKGVARRIGSFLRYQYDEKGQISLALPYYSIKLPSLNAGGAELQLPTQNE